MCDEHTVPTLRQFLRDPLIRLVMQSDGVTDHEMIALVRRVSAALAARSAECPESGWALHVQEGQAAW